MDHTALEYLKGTVEQQLDEIRRSCSKPDWDSYGARPVESSALDHAAKIAAMIRGKDPWIVPTSHGGIQLEWHYDGYDIEIGITPDGKQRLD